MYEIRLTDAQKTLLSAQAQPLAIAFECAPGDLTPEFVAQVLRHFKQHELVKIRLRATSRPLRASLIAQIVKKTECALVATQATVAVFYRAPDRPRAAHAG
jgi:RNA-binding protein YhbY